MRRAWELLAQRMRTTALAATLTALFVCVTPAVAQPEPSRTDQLSVVYTEPTDARHFPIRQDMQDRGLLEMVGALLSSFRLPRELAVEARGCDGREAAWYGFGRAVFCYEYVELILRHSPKVATPGGVQRADAIVGAVLDTILHEAAHGIIEILDIPVLGREEDAADFFSIYLLLQFPAEDARRLIQGVAFTVGSEAREDLEEMQRPQDFAGSHGLNAQRHYNVLCLAYGANPALFDHAVPAGLPPGRARNCGDEWSLLTRAFSKVVLPHVDEAKLRAAIAQVRFNWSPLATAAETFDKPPLEELGK
jgi:hypothetical protein